MLRMLKIKYGELSDDQINSNLGINLRKGIEIVSEKLKPFDKFICAHTTCWINPFNGQYYERFKI